MPRSPPAPVSATYSPGTATLQVVFDRFLIDGPIDHFNWSVRAFDLRRNGEAPASVSGKVVSCKIGAGIFAPGPDIVNYEPPPFDVRSRHDLPAAAFADFPLLVIP